MSIVTRGLLVLNRRWWERLLVLNRRWGLPLVLNWLLLVLDWPLLVLYWLLHRWRRQRGRLIPLLLYWLGHLRIIRVRGLLLVLNWLLLVLHLRVRV